MIDSVDIKDKIYYPQVLLEKKISNFNDDIEIYSDDCYNKEIYSDDCYNEDSVEKFSDDSDEENSDENIKTRKIEYINLFLEKIKRYDKFIF